MAELRPVPLRLVSAGWTDRVPAPAAETLTPAQRQRYVDDHPFSYLGVTRALDDERSPDPDDVDGALAASRASLDELLDAEAFSDVGPPRLHLYRLASGGRAQIGIVGVVPVAAHDRGDIRIHERVKGARARYLAEHRLTVGVESSPIALAHRPDPAIDDLVAAAIDEADPALDFVASDGLHQQVWPVDASLGGELVAALAHHYLYLIDGHHRAAAASLARSAGDGGDGTDGSLLAMVVSTDQLHNAAFHRCLATADPGELLANVGDALPARPASDLDDVVARGAGELALLADDQWYVVTTGGPDPPGGGGRSSEDPSLLAGLDAPLLQSRVLEPLLGIDETVPTASLTYRIGDGDRADLARLGRSGCPVVWAMRPVPVDTVLAVSDAGGVMPPKSTCFLPKVRSGLFLRHLDHSRPR